MNISAHRSSIKTIHQSDPRFLISDGLVVSPRAGFEVTLGCPKEYRAIIAECIDRGWLKAIANISERELLFIGLSDETS